MDPLPTKQELMREVQQLYEKGGYEYVFDNMDHKRLTRLLKLDRKERIKDSNALRKGGGVHT